MMDRALLERALNIPANERVELAQILLASIEVQDEGVRRSWIDEVQRRIASHRDGRSSLNAMEDVFE